MSSIIAAAASRSLSGEGVYISKRKRNEGHEGRLHLKGQPANDPPTKRRRDSTYSSETDVEGDGSSIWGHKQTIDFGNEPLGVDYTIPSRQDVLLLHAKNQPYVLEQSVARSDASEVNEVLIRVRNIGLNPIDWKAPDYGFGIPSYPYLAGREFVGQLVTTPERMSIESLRNLRKGDLVLVPSTDYRDPRKAAFQQYAVAASYNVCRIPTNFGDVASLSGLGVAFVAAAISLGVCFGTDFSVLSNVPRGPYLKKLLEAMPEETIPVDVRNEALADLRDDERPQDGEWLAIWGGSSTTAFMAAQLGKLLGLRIILVVDAAKHGEVLSEGCADLIVDSHDPQRAITIIKQVAKGSLRFGIDAVGKETATHLRNALRTEDSHQRSHLVGLTGLPKDHVEGVVQHTMPIKLFHEAPAVGEALMVWLEDLLQAKSIVPPTVELQSGTGLECVNVGLDRMRRGEIAGRRLAVQL